MKRAGLILIVSLVLLVGVAVGLGTGLASLYSGNSTPITDEMAMPTAPVTATVAPPTPPPDESVASLTNLSDAELNSLVPALYERSVLSVVDISTSAGAGGTGWVWDDVGRIVTNYHVVQCTAPNCTDGIDTDITVRFSDGFEYQATYLAHDTAADIAVLEVQGEREFMPLPVGVSADVVTGQVALAIGGPFGNDFSLSQGIVSAVGRRLDSGFSVYSIGAVIQTDAALNPGNSGGPLLDLDGRVIGINTQISASDIRQNSGVGYAVPIDLVRRVVPSLIANGEYQYSFLGISGAGIDRQVREAAGFEGDQTGILLSAVTPGFPAATAGLVGDTAGSGTTPNYDGDIILGIRHVNAAEPFEPLMEVEELIEFLNLYTSPGDRVELEVQRSDGTTTIFTVTLAVREN